MRLWWNFDFSGFAPMHRGDHLNSTCVWGALESLSSIDSDEAERETFQLLLFGVAKLDHKIESHRPHTVHMS